MGVSENRVEKYLDQEVKFRGGYTRKWSSQGVAGVPDRICFFPGRVMFVEVKVTDGNCSKQQVREQQRMHDMGADVCTVFGKEGVDTMLEEEIDNAPPSNEL